VYGVSFGGVGWTWCKGVSTTFERQSRFSRVVAGATGWTVVGGEERYRGLGEAGRELGGARN